MKKIKNLIFKVFSIGILGCLLLCLGVKKSFAFEVSEPEFSAPPVGGLEESEVIEASSNGCEISITNFSDIEDNALIGFLEIDGDYTFEFGLQKYNDPEFEQYIEFGILDELYEHNVYESEGNIVFTFLEDGEYRVALRITDNSILDPSERIAAAYYVYDNSITITASEEMSSYIVQEGDVIEFLSSDLNYENALSYINGTSIDSSSALEEGVANYVRITNTESSTLLPMGESFTLTTSGTLVSCTILSSCYNVSVTLSDFKASLKQEFFASANKLVSLNLQLEGQDNYIDLAGASETAGALITDACIFNTLGDGALTLDLTKFSGTGDLLYILNNVDSINLNAKTVVNLNDNQSFSSNIFSNLTVGYGVNLTINIENAVATSSNSIIGCNEARFYEGSSFLSNNNATGNKAILINSDTIYIAGSYDSPITMEVKDVPAFIIAGDITADSASFTLTNVDEGFYLYHGFEYIDKCGSFTNCKFITEDTLIFNTTNSNIPLFFSMSEFDSTVSDGSAIVAYHLSSEQSMFQIEYNGASDSSDAAIKSTIIELNSYSNFSIKGFHTAVEAYKFDINASYITVEDCNFGLIKTSETYQNIAETSILTLNEYSMLDIVLTENDSIAIKFDIIDSSSSTFDIKSEYDGIICDNSFTSDNDNIILKVKNDGLIVKYDILVSNSYNFTVGDYEAYCYNGVISTDGGIAFDAVMFNAYATTGLKCENGTLNISNMSTITFSGTDGVGKALAVISNESTLTFNVSGTIIVANHFSMNGGLLNATNIQNGILVTYNEEAGSLEDNGKIIIGEGVQFYMNATYNAEEDIFGGVGLQAVSISFGQNSYCNIDYFRKTIIGTNVSVDGATLSVHYVDGGIWSNSDGLTTDVTSSITISNMANVTITQSVKGENPTDSIGLSSYVISIENSEITIYALDIAISCMSDLDISNGMFNISTYYQMILCGGNVNIENCTGSTAIQYVPDGTDYSSSNIMDIEGDLTFNGGDIYVSVFKPILCNSITFEALSISMYSFGDLAETNSVVAKGEAFVIIDNQNYADDGYCTPFKNAETIEIKEGSQFSTHGYSIGLGASTSITIDSSDVSVIATISYIYSTNEGEEIIGFYAPTISIKSGSTIESDGYNIAIYASTLLEVNESSMNLITSREDDLLYGIYSPGKVDISYSDFNIELNNEVDLSIAIYANELQLSNCDGITLSSVAGISANTFVASNVENFDITATLYGVKLDANSTDASLAFHNTALGIDGVENGFISEGTNDSSLVFDQATTLEINCSKNGFNVLGDVKFADVGTDGVIITGTGDNLEYGIFADSGIYFTSTNTEEKNPIKIIGSFDQAIGDTDTLEFENSSLVIEGAEASGIVLEVTKVTNCDFDITITSDSKAIYAEQAIEFDTCVIKINALCPMEFGNDVKFTNCDLNIHNNEIVDDSNGIVANNITFDGGTINASNFDILFNTYTLVVENVSSFEVSNCNLLFDSSAFETINNGSDGLLSISSSIIELSYIVQICDTNNVSILDSEITATGFNTGFLCGKFESTSSTITLDSYTLYGISANDVILSDTNFIASDTEGNTPIKAKTITIKDDSNVQIDTNGYGLYCGVLTITGSEVSIESNDSSLFIKENVTKKTISLTDSVVDVKCGSTAFGVHYIDCPYIYLDNSSLTAAPKDGVTPIMEAVIYNTELLELTNNSILDITYFGRSIIGGENINSCKNDLYVKSGSKLIVKGSEPSMGALIDSIEVDNGTIEIDTGFIAFYCNTLSMDNNSVINGCDASTYFYAKTATLKTVDVTISQPNIDSGNTIFIISTGTSSKIEIIDSELNLGNVGIGLSADEIVISGSTYNHEGNDPTKWTSLTATKTTISDSELNISNIARAISFSEVSILSSDVTISGIEYGLYSLEEDSTVTIDSSSLTISECSDTTIYAGNVKFIKSKASFISDKGINAFNGDIIFDGIYEDDPTNSYYFDAFNQTLFAKYGVKVLNGAVVEIEYTGWVDQDDTIAVESDNVVITSGSLKIIGKVGSDLESNPLYLGYGIYTSKIYVQNETGSLVVSNFKNAIQCDYLYQSSGSSIDISNSVNGINATCEVSFTGDNANVNISGIGCNVVSIGVCAPYINLTENARSINISNFNIGVSTYSLTITGASSLSIEDCLVGVDSTTVSLNESNLSINGKGVNNTVGINCDELTVAEYSDLFISNCLKGIECEDIEFTQSNVSITNGSELSNTKAIVGDAFLATEGTLEIIGYSNGIMCSSGEEREILMDCMDVTLTTAKEALSAAKVILSGSTLVDIDVSSLNTFAITGIVLELSDEANCSIQSGFGVHLTQKVSVYDDAILEINCEYTGIDCPIVTVIGGKLEIVSNDLGIVSEQATFSQNCYVDIMANSVGIISYEISISEIEENDKESGVYFLAGNETNDSAIYCDILLTIKDAYVYIKGFNDGIQLDGESDIDNAELEIEVVNNGIWFTKDLVIKNSVIKMTGSSIDSTGMKTASNKLTLDSTKYYSTDCFRTMDIAELIVMNNSYIELSDSDGILSTKNITVSDSKVYVLYLEDNQFALNAIEGKVSLNKSTFEYDYVGSTYAIGIVGDVVEVIDSNIITNGAGCALAASSSIAVSDSTIEISNALSGIIAPEVSITDTQVDITNSQAGISVDFEGSVENDTVISIKNSDVTIVAGFGLVADEIEIIETSIDIEGSVAAIKAGNVGVTIDANDNSSLITNLKGVSLIITSTSEVNILNGIELNLVFNDTTKDVERYAIDCDAFYMYRSWISSSLSTTSTKSSYAVYTNQTSIGDSYIFVDGYSFGLFSFDKMLLDTIFYGSFIEVSDTGIYSDTSIEIRKSNIEISAACGISSDLIIIESSEIVFDDFANDGICILGEDDSSLIIKEDSKVYYDECNNSSITFIQVGSLEINNSSVSMDNVGYGIIAFNTIDIINSEVHVKALETGIYGLDINISEESVVNIEVDYEVGEGDNRGYAIVSNETGTLVVNNSTINASGKVALCLYGDALFENGAIVNLNASEKAIHSEGTVVVSSVDITTDSSNGSGDAYFTNLKFASGNMTIDGELHIIDGGYLSFEQGIIECSKLYVPSFEYHSSSLETPVYYTIINAKSNVTQSKPDVYDSVFNARTGGYEITKEAKADPFNQDYPIIITGISFFVNNNTDIATSETAQVIVRDVYYGDSDPTTAIVLKNDLCGFKYPGGSDNELAGTYYVEFLGSGDAGKNDYRVVFDSNDGLYTNLTVYYSEIEILPYELTIIWDEDDFTFNGEVQTINAYAFDAFNETLTLVVTTDVDFVYANTYTATAAFASDEPNYKLPDVVTKQYTMKKYQISEINWSDNNYTYDGLAQTITASYFDVNGAITPLSVTVDKIFKDAGDYVATCAFVEDDGNYLLPTVVTKNYTIKPLEVDIIWSENDFTYNELVQLVNAHYVDINSQDVELIVTLDKEFKDADSYIATAAFKNNETNYILVSNNTKEYEIKKLEVTNVTWCEDNYTYNGDVQEIIVSFKSPLNNDVFLSVTTNKEFKNAGDYLATATNINPNYEVNCELTKIYSIAKANYDMSQINFSDKIVKASANRSEFLISDELLPVGFDGIKLSVIYTGSQIDFDNLVAGSYVINAVFNTESENYNIPERMTMNLFVKQDHFEYFEEYQTKPSIIIDSNEGVDPRYDLRVLEVLENSEQFNEISQKAKDKVVSKIYDINFVDIDGNKYKNVGTIKLLIPTQLQDNNIVVYRYENGSLNRVYSKVEDGYVVINNAKNSKYVLSYENKTLIGVEIALVVALFAEFMFVIKKLFDNSEKKKLMRMKSVTLPLVFLILAVLDPSELEMIKYLGIAAGAMLVVSIFVGCSKPKVKEKKVKEKAKPVEEIKQSKVEETPQPVSLKESLAMANETGVSGIITKAKVIEHLKETFGDTVEIHHRPNRTNPGKGQTVGLLQADTHFVLGAKRACFVYVYENDNGSVVVLLRLNEESYQAIKESHKISFSGFPRAPSGNLWYSLIIDETFDEEFVLSAIDLSYYCNLGEGPVDVKIVEEEVEETKELTLKESLAMANETNVSGLITKQMVVDYLSGKYGDSVEIHHRPNRTNPGKGQTVGLLQADTHFVLGAKRACFVYVYENDNGSALVLLRLTKESLKIISKEHKVSVSGFPRAPSGNLWYSFVIDDTYTKEQVFNYLDIAFNDNGGKLEEKVVEQINNELSLKESLELAKTANSASIVNKESIVNYLSNRYQPSEIEIKHRPNYTNPGKGQTVGLLQADTHYVLGEKRACFAYVYEPKDSNILILLRLDEETFEALRKQHKSAKSGFPRAPSGNLWYSFVIDDTYTAEEVYRILDISYACNSCKKENELAIVKEEVIEQSDVELSLKESLALAKESSVAETINKQMVVDYLTSKYSSEEIEIKHRPNYTNPGKGQTEGLLQADTHYVLGEKRACFAYVYETKESSVLILLRLDKESLKELRKSYKVTPSGFPRAPSGNLWYSFVIDNTYKASDIYKILDVAYVSNGGKKIEFEQSEIVEEKPKEVSLKESLAKVKEVNVSGIINKQMVVDYLTSKYSSDEIEIKHRPNYTNPGKGQTEGLLQADTHYVLGEKRACFAYVYETKESNILVLLRLDEETVKKLKKTYKFNPSGFPRAPSGNLWYSFVIDSSYTAEDIYKLLDISYNCNKTGTPKVKKELEEKVVVEEIKEEAIEVIETKQEDTSKEPTVEEIVEPLPVEEIKEENKEESYDINKVLSLKEVFAIAKDNGITGIISKKEIVDYLKKKYANNFLEVNHRANRTDPGKGRAVGLPLPDTHYVINNENKICFAYVYEDDSKNVIMLIKTGFEYAYELSKNHKFVAKSSFPKSIYDWYSLVIDNSFTKEDIFKILDTLINKVCSDFDVQLKLFENQEQQVKKAITRQDIYQEINKIYPMSEFYIKEGFNDLNKEDVKENSILESDIMYILGQESMITLGYCYNNKEGNICLLLNSPKYYVNSLIKKRYSVERFEFNTSKEGEWYLITLNKASKILDIVKTLDALIGYNKLRESYTKKV